MKDDTQNLAKENMRIWLGTLLTKDPKQVASMYLETATFLPTVSGDFKRGQDGACDYFEHFLAKNPNGKVKEEEVIEINGETYLHVGMYEFEIDEDSKGRKVVEARFDYLWKKDSNGKWKIQHHHSSLRPQ